MVLFELVIAIVIAIGLLFIGGRINATSPYVKLFILRLPLDASIQAKLLVWFLPIPLAEHMAFRFVSTNTSTQQIQFFFSPQIFVILNFPLFEFICMMMMKI